MPRKERVELAGKRKALYNLVCGAVQFGSTGLYYVHCKCLLGLQTAARRAAGSAVCPLPISWSKIHR
jgi:hypothetical protein